MPLEGLYGRVWNSDMKRERVLWAFVALFPLISVLTFSHVGYQFLNYINKLVCYRFFSMYIKFLNGMTKYYFCILCITAHK